MPTTYRSAQAWAKKEAVVLTQRPFGRIRAWFVARDKRLQVDGAGLVSPRFGVGVYAPSALKQPEEPAEAVGVFQYICDMDKDVTQREEPASKRRVTKRKGA